MDSFLFRSHGWSKKGDVVNGHVLGQRFYRESFIAAKRSSDILSPFCFQGTCYPTLFEMWIENVWVPEWKPGQVVMMDNATFHKSKKTQEMIEKAQCQLIFLPPYSPDLNPIEKDWAWFKAKVKSMIHQFSSWSQAIDDVFSM